MASPSTNPAPAGSTAAAGDNLLAITSDGRIIWRRMLAFLCMILGMFLAILDIQIVSASISEVQAGLSASASEVTWVQTSYLIAEVIMIPLSGFLSRALGTRILFTGAAAGFTFASLMCGLSTTLGEMIFWRAVQGFVGGGMIPTVFATAYLLFPRDKQAYVNPAMGLIITLAPTIGPSVGGVVTDALSWHWLFFVNVIPGICVAVATYTLIDFDKPDLTLLRRFDWFGLATLTAFLGPLEYVLEEGARDNWFEDETITVCSAIAAVSGVLFFWRALTAAEPIVDIRAFRIPNFGFGCLLSFVVGIGLFGLTYLYPLYLSQVRGYSALMIGEALFVTGLTMFISAPIVGNLMTKLDPRLLIAVGFVAFAVGTWQMSGLTRDWDFSELLVPQILRGFGLMAAMAPINFLSLGSLPPERLKNAASLYNLTRTLGGAVGLAVLTTLMNARTDVHLARLREGVTAGHRPAVELLDQLTHKFASFGHDAPTLALKTLNDMVRRQGAVLAFGDIFLMMTVLFVVLLPGALLLRRPPAPGGVATADAH